MHRLRMSYELSEKANNTGICGDGVKGLKQRTNADRAAAAATGTGHTARAIRDRADRTPVRANNATVDTGICGDGERTKAEN